MEWISVKDKLPKADERIQICIKIKSLYDGEIHRWVTTAVYQDGTTKLSDWGDFDRDWLDNYGATYLEEDDDYLIPKGWYEIYTSWASEFWGCKLDDEEIVTHWRALPELPKEENDGTL